MRKAEVGMGQSGVVSASSYELRAARWVIVLVAICLAMGAGAQTAKERARVAAADVQRFYDPATGLFCSGAGDCWWYSANELTALVDYSLRVKSKDAVTVVANTFEKAGFLGPQKDALGPFVDTWTDDDGWWGLAWADAYDYAKVYDPAHAERYLTLAKNIFAYMAAQWEKGDCSGGLWQNQKPTHTKDAIANEVFFSLATGLYRRTGDKAYLDWGMREWKWFDGKGMVNSDHLAGSRSAHPCMPQGAEFWTYNQGVVLGGLTDLYSAYKASDLKLAKSLLARATAIADCVVDKACGGSTAIARFPLVDAKGILIEACRTNPCTYGPAYQFKGIFVRNLARLDEVTGKYKGFLKANAESAWVSDRNDEGLFGFYWAGPFYLPEGGKGAVQGTALDLMNTQVR